MKQFIQYILVATIFFINLNHSVSSEVIKRVYAEDLQSHLSAAGYDIDQIDGEWGQKSNAALVKYLQDNSFRQDTKISVKLFKTIRASLGDKAPLLKGEGKKSPYFIRDASSKWGELSTRTNMSPRVNINEKLKARKTINAFMVGKPGRAIIKNKPIATLMQYNIVYMKIGIVTILISILVMLLSPFIRKLMHGVH